MKLRLTPPERPRMRLCVHWQMGWHKDECRAHSSGERVLHTGMLWLSTCSLTVIAAWRLLQTIQHREPDLQFHAICTSDVV